MNPETAPVGPERIRATERIIRVGVEPEPAPTLTQALEAGRPVDAEAGASPPTRHTRCPGGVSVPGAIDARLDELKIELPAAAPPIATFVPCAQSGHILFVSGQITSWNGELRYVGKVGRDVSAADARAGARPCALNVLAQARSFLGGLDRVRRVCMVQGCVNAVPEFGEHPGVINGASDRFVEVFGADAGSHARFAVGAGSLPFNVAVEVAAVREVA